LAGTGSAYCNTCPFNMTTDTKPLRRAFDIIKISNSATYKILL
jgi:hypothetical protein